MLKGGLLEGFVFATIIHKYGLIYFNYYFFQRYKLIPNLLDDCLRKGDDIYDL